MQEINLMKLSISLGVFGPWQIIAIIVAFGLVIGAALLLVFLMGRRSAKKAPAVSDPDHLNKLERLNSLRESGALSEIEFEIEKRKILADS